MSEQLHPYIHAPYVRANMAQAVGQRAKQDKGSNINTPESTLGLGHVQVVRHRVT